MFSEGFFGLNVTLPLKELAFKIADERSSRAILTGSVNTLWKEGSKLHGETTDGEGLIRDLSKKGLNINSKRLVIIGAGGSARAILPSLFERNPTSITVVNRSKERAADLIKDFAPFFRISYLPLIESMQSEADLIINTSSAGTLEQKIILPKGIFRGSPSVYDLSYSSGITSFNMEAKRQGAKDLHDGLGMLMEQAAISFEIWNNRKPDVERAYKTLFS